MSSMKRFYIFVLLGFGWCNAYAQNIGKLEYFIDTDPGYGNATNVAITASPALTDFKFNVPLSSVGNGFHTLYVRTQNSTGKWSVLQSSPFVKLATSASTSRVEYFIDTDPGYGNGTSVTFPSGSSLTNLNFNVPLSSLAEGFHTLYVRVKDANNNWSVIQSHPFVKILAKPNITYIEYYIDTDPGQGNGINVPFTPTEVITDFTFLVNVTSLSQGTHKIFVRAKNSNEKWTPTRNEDFVMCNLAAPVATEATEVTSTSIKINWNAVAGAVAYDVDLSQNNFSTFSTGRITTGTVGFASPLTKGTTYQYRVRAVGSTCSSANSNVISVTTLNCDKPPKPTISLTNTNTGSPILTSSAATGNQWFKNGTLISGASNKTLTVSDPGNYKVQIKSGDCLSDFSDEIALVITGLEPNDSKGIVFYPNPVENELTIEGVAKILESKLTDVSGRIQNIFFKADQGKHQANVESLPSGMYILFIRDEYGSRYLKFSKK
jgi:hypothetical protein